MAIDYTIIGNRLKQARINKNFTQEELAEKIDISVAFLSRIERGKAQINLKRLSQICNILDITEGYILNGSSDCDSNYLNQEFNQILDSCSPDKQKLIYDIAKVISKS